MKLWIIASLLIVSACTKASRFDYPGLLHPTLEYSRKSDDDGLLKKTIYVNENEKFELIVSGPEIVPQDRALPRIEKKILQINQLYREVVPPYRGKVTKLAVCDKTFAPSKQSLRTDIEAIEVLFLFANSRKAFGVCTKEDIKYQMSYVFVYCKKSEKYFELKLYSEVLDRDEMTKIAKEFSCEPS